MSVSGCIKDVSICSSPHCWNFPGLLPIKPDISVCPGKLLLVFVLCVIFLKLTYHPESVPRDDIFCCIDGKT